MDAHGLHDLVPAGQNRVQRAQAVLENHGDLAAPDSAHLLFGQLQQVPALKEHLAPVADLPVLVIQAQNRLAGDGFAAAGFPHQA